jgi:hypothetical protein
MEIRSSAGDNDPAEQGPIMLTKSVPVEVEKGVNTKITP